MSPESFFSPESKKLYKRLDKRVQKLTDHSDLIIYAGRERRDSERPKRGLGRVSARCYVKFLKRGCADKGVTVYFEGNPSKELIDAVLHRTMKIARDL